MEQNKEIIRQLYIEASVKKQRQITDKAPGNNFTQYTVSAKPSSLKTFHNFFTAVNAAFPDYELYIDNLIARGDRVMARYTISGTHKGDFMGVAPTNQRMSISGIDVFRLDKGKVVQHWDAAHQMSALPQFGRTLIAKANNWVSSSLTTSLSGKKEPSLST